MKGNALLPEIEPIRTTRPLAARSAGMQACVSASWLVRLTSSWWRKTSSGMYSRGPATPMPALSTSPSSRSPTASAARAIASASVTSSRSSVVPVGAAPSARTPANTRHPACASRLAVVAPMPDEAPVTRTERLAKDGGGDLGALGRREAAVALDPLCPLVVAVQRVLPGESDAAVGLDCVLADRDCDVARVRLGGGRRNPGFVVLLCHAPRSPVRERAGELGVGVAVGELVRDRLVDPDRLAELLARLGVLDGQLERPLRDADGLERERRERPHAHPLERRSVADLLAAGPVRKPPEPPRRVHRLERL